MKVLLHLKVAAHLEHLGRLIEGVSDCAKAQGFSQKRISEIELAVEEAFVNICHYAYPEDPGEVEIGCRLDGHHLIIEIIDSGIPFDPTAWPDPDVTRDLNGRETGGLGIFLIKKMMDEVRYRREGNQNILQLVVHQDQ